MLELWIKYHPTVKTNILLQMILFQLPHCSSEVDGKSSKSLPLKIKEKPYNNIMVYNNSHMNHEVGKVLS